MTPTGIERTFGAEEIIVSKTDTRGFITYANDVFIRVCGYAEHELVGKPHSIIRHPEMPRCVFKLLWETIEAGDEIFAYVLNLAGDGAHYWVLAHVTPTFGPGDRIVGYHSNRRSPARSAIRVVQPLYSELLREESRHARPSEAMEASTAVLLERLQAAGVSYEQFVWSITPETAGRS
ncbi:MAG TPA: PAS domain-containing protein [Acidimicrobiales bacterium]|nr:PAS domain-containing protein [Acidimicrobiales bacterium]